MIDENQQLFTLYDNPTEMEELFREIASNYGLNFYPNTSMTALHVRTNTLEDAIEKPIQNYDHLIFWFNGEEIHFVYVIDKFKGNERIDDKLTVKDFYTFIDCLIQKIKDVKIKKELSKIETDFE